jgi:hypothetical protein
VEQPLRGSPAQASTLQDRVDAYAAWAMYGACRACLAGRSSACWGASPCGEAVALIRYLEGAAAPWAGQRAGSSDSA